MSEQEKKAKWAAYMQDYKKKNPQKINLINKNYYHKVRAELADLRAFKAQMLEETKKEEKVTK